MNLLNNVLSYFKSLTHNSTLRLIFSYLIVFVVSSLVLLSFVYWSSFSYIYQQRDHHILYDKESLHLTYQQEGEKKLIATIKDRLKQHNYESVYLLFHKSKNEILAGNLSSIPTLPHHSSELGLHTITLEKFSKSLHHKHHSARILQSFLSPNLVLINGLDTQSVHQQEHIIINSMITGTVLIFILGSIGGYVISLNTIKKINIINSAMQQVGKGSLQQRITLSGSDSDFDLLANNFNEMLDRLEILMQQVQNIATNIAHDLRTPLTRVRNRLETLTARQMIAQSKEFEAPIAHQNKLNLEAEIESAIDETDNLLIMFETILNINKFETGVQKTHITQISMTKLLADIYDYYEPLAMDKAINISLLKNANDVYLYADQNMLFLALSNIMSNAVKYTPEKGIIRLSFQQKINLDEHRQSCLEIIIADSGSGIEDLEKSKVFELFYRAEKHRSSSGNGLGLSLVAAIIHLHKGSITLVDNHPGLKVSISLPLFPL